MGATAGSRRSRRGRWPRIAWRRATCVRRTRPAWPRCRRRSSRGTPRSVRVTGVPAGTPRARVHFTRCGAIFACGLRLVGQHVDRGGHQRGIERRAGQLVEPAGGPLPRPGIGAGTQRAAGTRPRRPSRRRGRRAGSPRRRGRRDSPSRRGARGGGGGSRRRPGRAPGRARRGRRRASRGRAGSASPPNRRGRAEADRVGQGDHADVVQPGPDDAARGGRIVQPGLGGDRAGQIGHALDVGGRMPLADAGDERDRAGDVLGRAVRHEAEMGGSVTSRVSAWMPRRLEPQAGTAAIQQARDDGAAVGRADQRRRRALGAASGRTRCRPRCRRRPPGAVAPLTSAA